MVLVNSFACLHIHICHYLVIWLLPNYCHPLLNKIFPPKDGFFFSRGGGAFSISGFQLSYFIKDDLEYFNIFDR